MGLQFKDYQRENLKTLGTVASNAGKGGAITLIDKNFKDHTKRVALVVKRADGMSAVVACSKAVSRGMRDQEITLSQVQGFPILETSWDAIDENTGETKVVTGNFVSLPGGTQVEDFAITEDEAEEFVTPTIKLDELVAF
jgi:hypothetical protein